MFSVASRIFVTLVNKKVHTLSQGVNLGGEEGKSYKDVLLITLRTGDADLRFYITTVQDG